MNRTKKTLRTLAIVLCFVASAVAVGAAERQRTYSYSHVTAITPHDTNVTIKGAVWIQVTVAGNVVFNHRDATQSDAIPMAANQTFELGYQHVGIHTSTTATGIIAYWPLDVTTGPLP